MKLDISQKSDDERIALMFTAFFSYNLITLLINTIVNFFVPNTPVDTIICSMVYAYFIIFALEPVARRITVADLLFVFICILVYFSHNSIYPDNEKLLLEFFPKFIFTVLPLYLLGRSIRDYKTLLDYFEKSSHYIVFIAFAYYIILIASGQELQEDNMSFAYYLLPFVIISLYSVMSEFSLIALLRAVLSFITLVLTGTRGPLICLAISIVLFVFFCQKSKTKKFFWTIALIVFAFFLFSDAFINLIEKINDFLLSHDIENRIIAKLLDENLLDDSGRDGITMILENAVWEKPFIGYGIMGDRVLSGSYAHSLFYELIIDFGIITGVILFGFISLAVIRNILLTGVTKEYRVISILLISCVFVKLFLSGSYIQEPNFFLLLGIMLVDKNAKGIKENDQEICKKGLC